jgi:hypothetical protein
MFYLRYLCLCLLAHSGVQHIMRSVFLRLVYPMLAVSLECPFLISLSLFSNIYLYYIFVGIWIISSNLCKLVPTFFSQCHIRFQMCNLLGLKLRWWNVRHLFSHNPDFLNSIIYCLYIFPQMFSGVTEVILYTLCEVYYHLLLRLIDRMFCTFVICHWVVWYLSCTSVSSTYKTYSWHNWNIVEHCDKRQYMNSVFTRICHT